MLTGLFGSSFPCSRLFTHLFVQTDFFEKLRQVRIDLSDALGFGELRESFEDLIDALFDKN